LENPVELVNQYECVHSLHLADPHTGETYLRPFAQTIRVSEMGFQMQFAAERINVA
jgi:hypothetical protein